jgi:hypothetical protein
MPFMRDDISIRISVALALENELSDFIAFFEDKAGFAVEKEDSPGPFASIEWFLPTAIAIYIFTPYYQGFLSKMGEDHYDYVREVISKKFYTAFFGPKKKVNTYLVNSKGRVGKIPVFSRNLAFYATATHNGLSFRVKLLFLENATSEEVESSINSFKHLCVNFDKSSQGRSLAQYLMELDKGPFLEKLVWYNVNSDMMELIDWKLSSKTGKIVSEPIYFL